jgi:hypothetical protein
VFCRVYPAHQLAQLTGKLRKNDSFAAAKWYFPRCFALFFRPELALNGVCSPYIFLTDKFHFK